MKKPAEGRIHKSIIAIGNATYPVYIVRGAEKTLMIDSGLNHLGSLYLVGAKDALGHRTQLDYLFLTHSHYDHVGSADYLKQHFRGLIIGAHERTAALVERPSVVERMNCLSATHVEFIQHHTAGENVALHPFEIAMVLKQDDKIDLGGLTCTVYETPGHTRDSLAFFFPEIGALFPGDASGVLLTESEGSVLHVEFIASYHDYVDSLKLMITLRPEILCLAHNWVLTREDAALFLQHSLSETFRYRELIESHLRAAGGDANRATEEMLRAERSSGGVVYRPSAGYLTNLAARVKHIADLQRDEKA